MPEPTRSRPGKAAQPAAPVTQPTAPVPSASAERPLARERLREPPAPALRELPRELPELSGSRPPAYCARLSAGPLSESGRACGDSTLPRLASALEMSAIERRDHALARLEGCADLPLGWLRAVRAELARPCADVLVAPALRGLKAPLDADLAETLVGLAMAARWRRAVEKPPPYAGSDAGDSLEQYLAKTLRPWKARQLARVQALNHADALLEREGYGATIAAIARALTTHELYSVVRTSPIATQMKKDYERRTRYYSALDRELADIRLRIPGEDARVAQLLFEQGIHRAADADQWFGLQPAELANLLIAPPPEVEPTSERERIVRRLPGPYVQLLFGAAVLDDPRLVRLMVEQALTPQQRRALATRKLDAEMNEILAYFQAALALRTRGLGQFDEVVARLGSSEPRSASAELLLATARSARTGLRALPAEERGWVFDLTPLLALAEGNAPVRERALALNNAAWLSAAANTPASLSVASELLSRAQALAPDEGCLRPLYSRGFNVERPRAPCRLPLLP